MAIPVGVGPTDMASPGTMAYPIAQPVDIGTGSSPFFDASGHRKFYTFTGSIREMYDSNVSTSNHSNTTSYETAVSAGVLINAPLFGGNFGGRYTATGTYYQNPGEAAGGNSSTFELTHELNATYSRAISERFSLNVSELFRYFTEPSLYENTGTLYRNGPYTSNIINTSLTSQITPLIGGFTGYSNTVVHYDDSVIARNQDNIENNGSQSFSLTVLPTVTANAGANVGEVAYNDSRGYVSYTGYLGGSWQPTADLSLTANGGASYTVENAVPGISQGGSGGFSPYASVGLSWTTSSRTGVSFNYTHSVVPTDQINANGQEADRASFNGTYHFATSWTASLAFNVSHLTTSQQLIIGGISSYAENDYASSLSLSYHLNNHIDLDTGLSYSGVSSDIQNRDYTRTLLSFGIRGTY